MEVASRLSISIRDGVMPYGSWAKSFKSCWIDFHSISLRSVVAAHRMQFHEKL